ncbi:hypothetical protein [Gluconacetobacter tumulisoli]|uniref:Uncharacterized protein n=1 Tax=Gluconacetobacter tumulisoli TaxID=1286189 RepID=A0A7W4K8P9_9PROT|nr:hypothetical protein [Gluconacetobacter tumulisoli]MBB2202401.1 hypothetical protein [Gluconacetobacter tumulisoli]
MTGDASADPFFYIRLMDESAADTAEMPATGLFSNKDDTALVPAGLPPVNL